MNSRKTVEVDGAIYQIEDLPSVAKNILNSIQFVDAQIQQKQNEWAVADTARLAYANALKREERR